MIISILKTSVFTLLLCFTCELVTAQKYLTDESCIGLAEKYGSRMAEDTKITQQSSNLKLKEANNFRVTERNSDDSPRIVKFDYETTFGSRKIQTGNGTICLYFSGGFPIASYNDKNTFACSKFLYDFFIVGQYRPDKDGQYIDQAYRAFRKNILKDNESYQQVITKLRSYPAASNPKNCLGVITKNEKLYQLVWSYNKVRMKDYRGNDVGEFHLKSGFDNTVEQVNVDVKYYKNICDHDIVIKGIYKKVFPNREFEYHDDSRILKPNETTDYFTFTRGGWNDDSEYNVQYFFDDDIIEKNVTNENSPRQAGTTSTEQSKKAEYKGKTEEQLKIERQINNRPVMKPGKPNYNLNTNLPRTFTGTIVNLSIKKSAPCNMTLSADNNGIYTLKGEADNINLAGKWILKEKYSHSPIKENESFSFKGIIDFGYAGTGFPKGTNSIIEMYLIANENGITGKYLIEPFKFSIDGKTYTNPEQIGTFNLH